MDLNDFVPAVPFFQGELNVNKPLIVDAVAPH